MELDMHRGPSNLPTPPPDNIAEEELSKPGLTKFDSGMDIDFHHDPLHSPLSPGQPSVPKEVSKTPQSAVKEGGEEGVKDVERRKPSVDDFDFLTTLG